MNRMKNVNEGGTNNLLAQYSWDALSRAHSISYGDGTSDVYLQYDNGNNLQTLTQTYGTGSSVTFNYTWLMNHQLNSAGVNNPLFQYVPQAGAVNYGAADVDNGLTTAGGASMTYDGNHNLTYDGRNTLSYDAENRMVQAESAAWGMSTYLYDPLGQRKQKVVGVNTAMPVATDFVLAGGAEIADYYETSATWRLTVRGAGGLPLVTVVPAAGGGGEEIVYVHHDMKGSTVALTVPGGSGPAESYTYSDYGAPQSGTWLAYQYAGYRYDSETELYNMPARSYSPALGRFLQSDPAGFDGGFNLYAYAENDPVNLEDSTGLSPDGGELTVTLSESVPTPFMAAAGGPSSMIVSATATCGGCFAQLKYRPTSAGSNMNHALWYVQGSDGKRRILTGGPDHKAHGAPESGFLNEYNIPADGDKELLSPVWFDGGFSAANCKGVDKMEKAANAFPKNKITYNWQGPNSNSAARYLGTVGGFSPSAPPLTTGWSAPISGVE
jgi:RHS repeat-associated protein